MNAAADRARELQRQYWSPAPEEKKRLLSRGLPALSWKEKLRLLHLACLDELATGAGRRVIEADDLDPEEMPAGPNRDLVTKLLTDLRSPKSPFRPRQVAVWTGMAGESDQRPPTSQGTFENASLTHLGSLEVVRLDARQQPTELAFEPLDDLRGVLLASRAIFRLGKLLYEDGRPDEIVMLPLVYGISWATSKQHHTDGSLTSFVWHLPLPGAAQNLAIGLGHQDFTVAGPEKGAKKGTGSLIGLGSIGELMVALSLDDPRFDQKARARGLDPATVRRDAAGKK